MLPSHSLDTVDNLDYWILSVDAGMKYKGIFLQTEFYTRRLYDFELNPNSTGPLPVTQIVDKGFYVQAAFYPFKSRSYRLNLQVMDVNRSPAGSTFGYYTGGQNGMTVATAFSVFF